MARLRERWSGGHEWVEPSNRITHAVMADQVPDPGRNGHAPDNVVIAASSPPQEQQESGPAAAEEKPAKRKARAG